MTIPTICEKTELWFKTTPSINHSDGKAIRGYFGKLYKNRPEFHHHLGNRFLYSHPLIQYKVVENQALLAGMQEGAYLLKAITNIDHLELYNRRYTVTEQSLKTDIISFGLCSDTILYEFIKPWLGLNQKNYSLYGKMKYQKQKSDRFLSKIIVGNLLSVCKSLRYVADLPIHVRTKLYEVGGIEIKKNVNVLGFKGVFETNFCLPDYWGIGKSSSRGYGVVLKRKK